MKLKYPALLALLCASSAHATEVFINEIHYDNDGADESEFIEVVAPIATDLSGWTVALYNGSSSQLSVYETLTVSEGATSVSDGGGYSYYVLSPSSIQNGSPDGMALVDADGAVIQFLSYEGSLTAASGPAAGLTSVDIGVEESSSTPIGYSLQLSGAGSIYSDFAWQAEALNTAGASNNDQSFSDDDGAGSGSTGDTSSLFINEIHYDNDGSDTNEGVEIAGVAGTDLSGVTLVLYNGNSGAAYGTEELSGIVPDQDNEFGTLSFAISGLQNGAPDGFALVDADGVVLQFISYEGSMVATDGAAEGMTSIDIGVAESSSTPEGTSLQLVGTGTAYSEFTWAESATESFGLVNAEQSFGDNDGGGEEPQIGACFETETTGFKYISEVQGSGAASEFDGSAVIVEGVVTALTSSGYFLQEELADEDADSTTSEGIYVYSSQDFPAVGEIVRVAGTVDEYYDLTEITSVTEQLVCEGSADVTTVSVTMPLADGDDLEYYEGMIVSVSDLTVFDTATLWQYGEMGLSNELKPQPTDKYAPLSTEYYDLVASNAENIIYVEDNTSSSYPDELSFYTNFSYANPIRIGDTVSATGPLNYSYDLYRINPIEEVIVYSERDAAPVLDEGDMKIATFNVLNYFNGEYDEEGNVTFDYSENRGAENLEEFELQEARIVEAIVTLDADVVGLMEIENDGFGENSAIQSLVTAVNAQLAEEEHYSFVATSDESLVGTDAIAVGLIYKAAVVTPSEDAIEIDMPSQLQVAGDYQQMRVSLLQTFTHDDSGQEFSLVVNHFKSKGSTCYEDEVDSTELDTIQGSCNALRVSAAVTLAEALAAADLPEKVMILGDLNAYSAEDPVAVLTEYSPEERGYTITTAINTELDDGASVEVTEGYGYENVAETFDADGFSYWYYDTAQTGSLDHILASSAFMDDIVDATHWSINSVEAYQLQYDQALSYYRDEDGYAFTDVGPYRSSDHDPFVVSVVFEDAETPIVGDINGDGKVSARDYFELIKALGSKEGTRRYIAAADMNGNGTINLLDRKLWVIAYRNR